MLRNGGEASVEMGWEGLDLPHCDIDVPLRVSHDLWFVVDFIPRFRRHIQTFFGRFFHDFWEYCRWDTHPVATIGVVECFACEPTHQADEDRARHFDELGTQRVLLGPQISHYFLDIPQVHHGEDGCDRIARAHRAFCREFNIVVFTDHLKHVLRSIALWRGSEDRIAFTVGCACDVISTERVTADADREINLLLWIGCNA